MIVAIKVMQQNSGTLIFDLNTMKGMVMSYLKKNAQSFKTEQFQAWKIASSRFKSLKTVFSHLNIIIPHTPVHLL